MRRILNAARAEQVFAHGLGLAILLFLGGASGFAQQAEPIPERPEKLEFAPLVYEPPDPAAYRVEMKSGPVAYVVPDLERPLIDLVIYVRAGEYLQPQGKEGLAALTGYLLARGGTQSKSAEDLEEELAFLAARLDSSLSETYGTVSLNLLSKDLAAGLKILREILTAPRFQEDKVALRKQQTLNAMKQRNDDSADIEQRERRFLAYGDNFWINRHVTAVSLEGISHGDLVQFHQQWFHPKNFVLAVSGDFDRETMIKNLESLLSDWPFAYHAPPSIPTNTAYAASATYIVDKEVNQGRVSILMPGLMRDDPDFFAVTVMNDILGGGGFTSRIMNRVRSDEGLAYAASSAHIGGVYFPGIFVAGFQSKSRTVPYAASIVLEEIKGIRSDLVGANELTTAKKSFTETFPRNFASKSQVANTFAMDELTGRYAKQPGYWKTYRAKIDAVTQADVQRVAGKFLQPDKLAILVVGEKKEILLGHPDHAVKLPDLTHGRIIDVPLRDPMTMKPIEK